MVTIGRKGLYEDWLTDDGLLQIKGWARDGLTNEQIAHNIGITGRSFAEWVSRFPSISSALKKGKAPVDIEVENALLKRALGYEVEETITEVEETPTGRADAEGRPLMRVKKHVRKVKRHIPPDVTAQIFWLKNRRPGKWRDKIETAPENGSEAIQAFVTEARRLMGHD